MGLSLLRPNLPEGMNDPKVNLVGLQVLDA